ncbi:hypothetical protein EZS27_006077 [termite gut metagenome]|uniref:Uncharacterized protein n=1 Tax=termite gut metagenome TaxID=433724 RepID=A0A5J4SK67_9ZZZZ
MKTIISYIKRRILASKVNKAINLASDLSEKDGRKYVVLFVKGIPCVYAKAELRLLIRKGAFKKGTRIQDLERIAVFTTK